MNSFPREGEKERKDTNEKVRKEMSIVKNDRCVFFRVHDYRVGIYFRIYEEEKQVPKQTKEKYSKMMIRSLLTVK